MDKVHNKAKQMLNEQEEGSSFDFSAIPGLCISNWHWFVLCITLTCSAAFIYLRITPPVYVRTASIVVKDDKESEALDNVFTKFRNGKSIMPNQSLNNEIIAFRKANLMEKV
ncbi:MAG: Wzz/FepE/Etk N-terminal domain-containing protein, partial [Clostridia bacterium]|nr:Wzz/FepE/Etk N-terminal domain-containing protein [Clostridia bacterium]